MRCYISIVCALSVLAALSHAAPYGLQLTDQQGSTGLAGAFNTTALVTTLNQKIQLLRRFCPQLFQVIDTVVQNITSQVFSVVGRVILRNGLGGGGGGNSGGSVESRVSVVLPTFPPDDEDYDDEEESDNGTKNAASTDSNTKDALDVRMMSSDTSTGAGSVALSANVVDADGPPFTGEKKLEHRLSETDAESVPLFEDGDCGEPLVTKTSIASVNKIDIPNRSSFVDTATIEDSISMTTTGNENLDVTTSSSDNENAALDELRKNSINAIFKSIIEVENSEVATAEATTTVDSAAELSTEENAENSTTQLISSRFDVRVLDNGDEINTIPLIEENVHESDNLIRKRSPASDTGRSRRVVREAEADQDASASGGNGPDPADLSDIEAEDSERDKRYLPFGGDAHVSGGGGGSGNFLFDIIRRTADGAARAAGTVYRMVAGTENLGIGLSATSTATRLADASAFSQLIAGSGATEESDEKENAGLGGVAEIDVAKSADGYTEGIPGPITRLFVIANRGLANLVQDLILRLAATSERIVNFKARLITALI